MRAGSVVLWYVRTRPEPSQASNSPRPHSFQLRASGPVGVSRLRLPNPVGGVEKWQALYIEIIPILNSASAFDTPRTNHSPKMPKVGKPKSKRVSTRLRHKIEKHAASKQRKDKKLAKKVYKTFLICFHLIAHH